MMGVLSCCVIGAHIWQKKENSWLDLWGPVTLKDVRMILDVLGLTIYSHSTKLVIINICWVSDFTEFSIWYVCCSMLAVFGTKTGLRYNYTSVLGCWSVTVESDAPFDEWMSQDVSERWRWGGMSTRRGRFVELVLHFCIPQSPTHPPVLSFSVNWRSILCQAGQTSICRSQSNPRDKL